MQTQPTKRSFLARLFFQDPAVVQARKNKRKGITTPLVQPHSQVEAISAKQPEVATHWLKLEIKLSEGARVITIDSFPAKIGRTSAIAIADGSVSGHHATITQAGGKFLITDQGSKNGTQVDSATLKAHSPIPLEIGQTIVLGRINATVVDSSKPAQIPVQAMEQTELITPDMLDAGTMLLSEAPELNLVAATKEVQVQPIPQQSVPESKPLVSAPPQNQNALVTEPPVAQPAVTPTTSTAATQPVVSVKPATTPAPVVTPVATEPKKFCAKCGTANTSGGKFCAGCGGSMI